MYSLLHTYIRSRKTPTLLDFLLPRLVDEDFCRFADCGAGVGNLSMSYAATIQKAFPNGVPDRAKVAVFEPLPENFEVILKYIGGKPMFDLQQKAVADYIGTANFHVPNRVQGAGQGMWAAKTSYSGMLSTHTGSDHITVPVTRLDQYEPYDFVKFDLQGGEVSAIAGMGSNLDKAKLIYAEMQFLKAESTAKILHDAGFVVLFDRMQFGCSSDDVPLAVFDDCGLELVRYTGPKASGFESFGFLTFKPGSSPIDPDTLSLRADLVEKLRAAGLSYLQTDVLALHPRIAGHGLKQFADL